MEQNNKATSVQSLLNEWIYYFNTHDIDSITAMYSEDAILLPTFELICINEDQIATYFFNLLKKDRLNCQLVVDFANIQKNPYCEFLTADTIVNNGVYIFSFYENGKFVTQRARYTFVFHKNLIVSHHSSVDPE
jgi:hypothetical protein